MQSGASEFETTDFYTGKPVRIPLDPRLSAVENGKQYFKKYAKLKRTSQALGEIVVQTKEEIDYLESVLVSLDLVRSAQDIAEIRKELSQTGYGRKSSVKGSSGNAGKRAANERSQPLHFISSDGFHMYVGKNNLQNEELTFHMASGTDWWFHAKEIPGSTNSTGFWAVAL